MMSSQRSAAVPPAFIRIFRDEARGSELPYYLTTFPHGKIAEMNFAHVLTYRKHRRLAFPAFAL